MNGLPTRPVVLVFAGHDPSGGAGIQADSAAIGALGAHPMAVVTVLTVQDNDHVHEVQPVAAELVRRQAQALIDKMPVAAVKIGILGDSANAGAVAAIVRRLRQQQPDLPVVLDPVLASGHGDVLGHGRALDYLAPLLALATVVTPNLPEARALCTGAVGGIEQAAMLFARGCRHVLIKGGHADASEPEQGQQVVNVWHDAGTSGAYGAFGASSEPNVSNASGPSTVCYPCAVPAMPREWRWERLPGAFHGSGCTLAAALAALLAHGLEMGAALALAQDYCQRALQNAYAIAAGQLIPNRFCLCDPARPDHTYSEERR